MVIHERTSRSDNAYLQCTIGRIPIVTVTHEMSDVSILERAKDSDLHMVNITKFLDDWKNDI